MSDDEDSRATGNGQETRGQMLQRHKRELLDLKKGKAGRGLSKKELAQKETELKAKHEAELAALEKILSDQTPTGELDEKGGDEASTATTDSSAASTSAPPPKQPSRAQKRKAAKQKAAQDRQAQIEEEIANAGPDKRAIEQEQMLNKLLEKDKVLRPVLPDYPIRPDGNCMFAAVVDQLNLIGRGDEYDTNSLRARVADFIADHTDDYLPFVAEDEESFREYCETMKNTSAWGGQVELQAISRLLKTKIHVFHADSDDLVMGEEYPDEIFLSYHKYEFTLGEHYNSVGPLTKE